MLIRPDTLAMTAVLALLTMLGPLSTDLYLPSMPAIARYFGTGTAEAQLTLSAYLFGFAAGQIVHGPMSDRFGRRPVLLAGFALFVVASTLCALAPSIEALIAARFLQAIGSSGPIVLARAIVRDLYEGPRAARELARMGTIMGLMPAVAPVIGGFLQEAFGWRANFVAIALTGIAIAAVAALALPETLRLPSCRALTPRSMVGGYGVLLANRSYRVYVLLAALSFTGLFAFLSGSSFVLQGVYGLDEVTFGLSFSVPVIGFVGGTLLAQRLVGSRGLVGTIAVGTASIAIGGLMMLGLFLLGTGSSLEITLPMIFYSGGIGLVLPQTAAAAMMPFPDRAGAASSLLGLCQMAIAAVGGILTGHLVDHSPLFLPLIIAAVGLAAFAVFQASRALKLI